MHSHSEKHRNIETEEPTMKVGVACDHAGFPLKDVVVGVIRQEGHEPIDLGTHSTEPVDYPDIAEKLGRAIQEGKAERGVLLCGSGVGAAVAANKMRGIRAGVCHDTYSAHQCVEHDDANVLALGGRVIGPEVALELVRTFLRAKFTGEERHVRRLKKVLDLERREAKRPAE
jgi:RpiB/LacA/LacB family sugar-phosphate isomerase